MSTLSWRARRWLLAPIIKLLLEDRMAKDKDAAKQLEALQEETSKAIDAVEAHIAADEETDWATLQPLLVKQAQLNTRLVNLGGVHPTGSDTATPTDARTGLPVETETTVSGPVVEDSPQAAMPGETAGNSSGDNGSSGS